MLFENGFTPHPPLHALPEPALWTGQYTKTNGSRDNLLPLKDDRETMAGVLHGAGYKLGLFGKNHIFTPAQLKRWFDVDHSYSANTTAGENALNRGLSPESLAQMQKHEEWIREMAGKPSPSPFPKELFTTHVTNQRAMDFIESVGGPFAAWISILDPHPPMQAPEEFARMYPPDEIKRLPSRAGEMKTKNTRMQIFDYQIRGSELPEKFLRQYLSIYSGMIAFIDNELGRLMALLDRKGLTDNTIIVFSADHGDYAAQHRLIYKSGSMLDSLVHVPFLVSWPGHLPQGHREDALVSQVDIMPTLLEFCGLPEPRGVEGQRPRRSSPETRGALSCTPNMERAARSTPGSRPTHWGSRRDWAAT